MKPAAKKSGAAIATAVATLIFTGAVPISVAHAEAKDKCIGANACRGKSDCSTGKSACGGATANSCKGKGFLLLTKAECDRIPGTKFVSK
jgi:uncharacterized membrane protein